MQKLQRFNFYLHALLQSHSYIKDIHEVLSREMVAVWDSVLAEMTRTGLRKKALIGAKQVYMLNMHVET